MPNTTILIIVSNYNEIFIQAMLITIGTLNNYSMLKVLIFKSCTIKLQYLRNTVFHNDN